MNIRFSLIIIIAAFIHPACNRPKIILQKVSNLPEYFFAGKHFGRDYKSIDERNDFLLVTGKIDTADEAPAIHQAVITINRKQFFLSLYTAQANNDQINEAYSGSGYDLELIYKETRRQDLVSFYEGKIIIKNDHLSSEYNVVGTSGYH